MESAYAKVCCVCSLATKYRYIGCKSAICNRCSIAELDEKNEDWIAGKQVGYCSNCNPGTEFIEAGQPSENDMPSYLAGLPTGSPQETPATSSPSSATVNLSLDEESDTDKESDEILNIFTKKREKKKTGRKAQWSESLLLDMIDIIVSSDYYKRKLMFTNNNNQKSGEINRKVLDELKIRASSREENVSFTAVQLRNKFLKCVSECKKVALTIKTATGIKRFTGEKHYGPWFNQLFALIKTRDSCQPEQAIEPFVADDSSSGQSTSIDGLSANSAGEQCVPQKKAGKKGKSVNALNEIIGVVKTLVENDPMKDYLEIAREEAELAGQHEMRIMQIFMSMQLPPMHQQAPMHQPPAHQQPPLYHQQQNLLHNMQTTNTTQLNSAFFTRCFERDEQENSQDRY